MEVVDTPLNPFVRGELFSLFLLWTLANKVDSILVNFVSPGSPAEAAVCIYEFVWKFFFNFWETNFFPKGIRFNDEIIEFGSLNATNFRELTQISDIVKHRQNERIMIRVQRDNKIHELHLVPQAWNGRGLLGCNVVVFDGSSR